MQSNTCTRACAALGHQLSSRPLKGHLLNAPHLTERTVKKYLPPAPSTAKGHMKRPRKGLRSTTIKPKKKNASPPTKSEAQHDQAIHIIPQDVHPANLEDAKENLANAFCFGAFADKNTGVVYTDLTGNSPICPWMGTYVSP